MRGHLRPRGRARSHGPVVGVFGATFKDAVVKEREDRPGEEVLYPFVFPRSTHIRTMLLRILCTALGYEHATSYMRFMRLLCAALHI